MKSLRFASIDALPAGLQEQARKALAGIRAPVAPVDNSVHNPGVIPKPNKYGAVPTEVDGIRFASKREAAYYVRLCMRVQLGEVRYFLRQVPIHLPGGTRLVIDFLEHHADGSLHYVDVKGRETPAFKIKRREIQHHYPITIELA